jgi:hypothetical protein
VYLAGPANRPQDGREVGHDGCGSPLWREALDGRAEAEQHDRAAVLELEGGLAGDPSLDGCDLLRLVHRHSP